MNSVTPIQDIQNQEQSIKLIILRTVLLGTTYYFYVVVRTGSTPYYVVIQVGLNNRTALVPNNGPGPHWWSLGEIEPRGSQHA